MEWLPALLDLVVRVVQISAGLALAYGGYLAILQMSAQHEKSCRTHVQTS